MRDIHDYKRNLENSLERIESLSPQNQKMIKDFVNYCKFSDISTGRIAKYVNHLINISKWLGKDFDKVDIKDIENLTIEFKNHSYTAWTIKDYKVATKKFYKFLKREDLVSWIKTTIKRNMNEDLPNEVYTLDEVERLIDAADNPRDKALVSLLYESGCRISEFLNIKIKDIAFEQDYAMINVMGKTGNRSIPISKSIPLIKTWLNYYNQKDKDAYLFNLEYRNASKILHKIFKRAKIDKPFNPHQFRHSRATELAKQLTEAQMNQFFGWTQASSMARVYVHLTGRDLVPKLVIQAKTKKCLKCGFENPVDLKFCSSCLMPLDKKDFAEKVEQEDLMKNLYKLATNDKEWLEFTTKRLHKFMK